MLAGVKAIWSDLADDRVGQLPRGRLAAQVRRPHVPSRPPARSPPGSGRARPGGRGGRASAPGPDRADRVGDALAGDVGRRAVNRLEHRRVRPLGVDVAARRHAEAARDRRADVGQDVAEQVRATMTSSVCGCVTMRAASASTWYLRNSTSGSPCATIVHDLVPQHHRVLQRVRLGGAGQHLARPRRRQLERVARDALDAVAREDAGLLGHFVRRADVQAAADAGVLALGVLAHADHVDVGGAAVGERRGDARQQPHRPQVHVLVEALAQRQDQLPDRDVIGHRGQPMAPR